MAISPTIQQALLKTKVVPRATSQKKFDLRSTNNSFIDGRNSLHMLNEIDDVDDEVYVPAYLTQVRD